MNNFVKFEDYKNGCDAFLRECRNWCNLDEFNSYYIDVMGQWNEDNDKRNGGLDCEWVHREYRYSKANKVSKNLCFKFWKKEIKDEILFNADELEDEEAQTILRQIAELFE